MWVKNIFSPVNLIKKNTMCKTKHLEPIQIYLISRQNKTLGTYTNISSRRNKTLGICTNISDIPSKQNTWDLYKYIISSKQNTWDLCKYIRYLVKTKHVGPIQIYPISRLLFFNIVQQT